MSWLSDWVNSFLYCPPPYHEQYARVDGANLFPEEYSAMQQFKTYKDVYDGNTSEVVMRMPMPPEHERWPAFKNAVLNAQSLGIQPIALFDCYYSSPSMNERINWMRSNTPKVRYFELFNEQWQMEYPGEVIPGLDALVSLTNDYCKVLKSSFGNAFVISMAPGNSLQPIDYEEWGTDNAEIVETLIKQTPCDACAVHLYAEGASQANRFRKFCRNLKSWLDEAQEGQGYRKKVFVTECGYDGWDGHVDCYDKWTSRYVEYAEAAKVVWYRHTIDRMESNDSGFALECRADGRHSPLWDKLIAKGNK